MADVLQTLSIEAAGLFATTILLAVFFLVARVGRARQSVALAFATMPLLLTWAAQGLVASLGGAAFL